MDESNREYCNCSMKVKLLVTEEAPQHSSALDFYKLNWGCLLFQIKLKLMHKKY